MKRMLLMGLALILSLGLISGAALAEELTLPDGVVTVLSDGSTADFDGDGTAETLSFVAGGEEYGPGWFTLAVGDQNVTVENCESLTGRIAALKLSSTTYYNPGAFWGTLFLVDEYGPSSDPLSYCYLYTGGQLYDVGTIPALSEAIACNWDGTLTTNIRASYIGTWSRPADYELASGTRWTDGYQVYYRLSEVPRDIYPMGMIVTLNEDLPLYAARYDTDATRLLEYGQQVILAATDDARWLYVTSMDGETAGWVVFEVGASGYGESILIDGIATPIDDVFADIVYAD